jgi:hypothetical protein
MGQKKDDHTESNGNLFQRRGFVKTVGVAVASLAGASATAGAAENYDVVEVPAGGHKSYSLSDGETFENVLFDCTNSNTRVSITATGENWTIRNVGIKGVHDQDGGHAVLGLKAANGTDCRVENVWMGDGSSVYDGASSSETGAWVSPKSTGTITFKRCLFAGWKDNGIYASAPGGDGNGSVVIDECYAANNNHADFRIGSTGSVVKNSAVEHTKSTGTCRGVWCWHNPGLEIRNVDIHMQGNGTAIHAGPYEPGEVDVYDTQYAGPLVENGKANGEINLVSGNGTSPSVSVPEGVPSSAKEAASGSSSSADGSNGASSSGGESYGLPGSTS